jgi:hypothetical protein
MRFITTVAALGLAVAVAAKNGNGVNMQQFACPDIDDPCYTGKRSVGLTSKPREWINAIRNAEAGLVNPVKSTKDDKLPTSPQ